ncbi:MAG: hypothetical protein K0S07_1200 [Chlamydiales bacterium]|jgi:hypothetical protein|nr:hypothetical protein [Chlamydiales bacterium]
MDPFSSSAFKEFGYMAFRDKGQTAYSLRHIQEKPPKAKLIEGAKDQLVQQTALKRLPGENTPFKKCKRPKIQKRALSKKEQRCGKKPIIVGKGQEDEEVQIEDLPLMTLIAKSEENEKVEIEDEPLLRDSAHPVYAPEASSWEELVRLVLEAPQAPRFRSSTQ